MRNNLIIGPKNTMPDHPEGNYWTEEIASVGFVNLEQHNYRLRESSPWYGKVL